MKTRQDLPLREAWIIFFLLGVVMLNFPFLHIFNKELFIFGIPLLVLYLLIGWPVSIFIIYLFSLYLSQDSSRAVNQAPPGKNQEPKEQP